MLRHLPRADADEQYKEIMRGEEGNLLGIVLRNRVLKATSAAGCVTVPRNVQTKSAPTRNARQ